MQPSRLRTLLEYLLDNLFDVATIVVAGYLVVRHQIQPFAPNDFAELANWILAVLGLVAVSGLWERNRRLHRIEKLSEESRNLIFRRFSGKVQAEDFFVSERRLSDKTLASANVVFLSGITLTRTMREHMHVLSQRLAAGAYIRVIVVDPTVDPVLEELVLRSKVGDTTAGFWRSSLEATQAIVEAVATTPGGKGRLEIGYLPYIPSFGLAMIDPDEQHGSCLIELYHHRSAEPKATFELLASDDSHWYGFFRRQYETLWNSCRVEQLSGVTQTAEQRAA